MANKLDQLRMMRELVVEPIAAGVDRPVEAVVSVRSDARPTPTYKYRDPDKRRAQVRAAVAKHRAKHAQKA